ncbi:carbohydrate kinase family protein [Actinoplanes palleronii]|uniref:Carbohydrate kinase PfkB domain-containing protein n=1 Tax=Actinoplanes palleronii TaxID=113570 RepID=A0ABQ4BG22_9ACTN|nr:sugar kinase [Actinoplanes palleronii]GIE69635.1 hypothetical protein Apa02nite_057430 [Actinoplanes palleronii]
MPEFDVLVVGDANPDLLLRGDVRPRFGQQEQLLTGADLVLGGSAAITAAGCARLGLRTALLTAVGKDFFGTLVRDHLASLGVRVLAVESGDTPTGLTVVLAEPDDRAMLTLPGTIAALRPSDVTAELLSRTRHVHVASLYLQPVLAAGLAGVFAAARTAGVSTSLDTNWDPTGEWSWMPEILPHTDVFLPNAAELLAVTGAASPSAAAEQLVANGATVVMKDGARGAQAWWPGGSCTAPGVPVQVVDAVGAGDSFNAGFLAARLSGRDLPSAVSWAAVAGSLSTRAAGGTAAQATPDDLPHP